MSNYLDSLIVYSSQHPKIRIGSKNDGGYVIADNLNYNKLISCGISDNIDFENQFIEKYGTECLAYDGTISNIPNHTNNIIFIRKNISRIESDNSTNLIDVIENHENIFLKMDIETNEYHWIELLDPDHLNKFVQIVIEFHFPFSETMDDIFKKLSDIISVDRRVACLQKIASTHYLIHLHGNNCCGTMKFENILIPNVFECTYIRKDLCINPTRNDTVIPDLLLDTVNIIGANDIYLDSYPFIMKDI